MENWYLIYTKARAEDLVSMKLLDAGLDVMNPKIKQRRYVRRKLTDTISPLFPCYVFVRFDLEYDYRKVRYTRGVRRVVGTGEMPDVVPDAIVESIRQKMKDGPVEIKPSEFEPGDEVYIKGGPMEGFAAVFEREIKGSERVSILLRAVNVRVVTDRAMVEKT